MSITIIMIIGAVFIGLFSLPNLISVLRTKDTAGINLMMYLIFLLACTMFMIYGLGMTLSGTLSGGLPTLISNLFCVMISIITLIIKFKNKIAAKKHHMTEEQYCASRIKAKESSHD